MYIKFTGPDIAGSSTQKGFETHIEVHSWNYGAHQPASPIRSSAGGATMEKVHHSPFIFTKEVDTASDDLLKMCWSGQHIDKASFTMHRSTGDVAANNSGTEFLKIELESIVVQDFSISGGGGTLPIESLSLNFQKITWTYKQQDIKEGVDGGAQVISHDQMTHVIA